MGEITRIAWTDATFNPWWGCQKVSPGCEHCYAESLSKRWGYNIWGPASTTLRRTMAEAYWRQPFRWDKKAAQSGKPFRVFCGSMCDVFEDNPQVEPERVKLWDTIEVTPHLDWLLLTKRPENILRMLPQRWLELPQLPLNIWMGATAEDQQRADERIPLLLKVPARVRFLSCEPLIAPVDLTKTIEPDEWAWDEVNNIDDEAPPEEFVEECELENDWINFGDRLVKNPEYVEWMQWRAKTITLGSNLDWVIVGGESGAHARPMQTEWAQSLIDQCRFAKVAAFMKQLGGHPDKRDDPTLWPPDLRIRHFPEVTHHEHRHH